MKKLNIILSNAPVQNGNRGCVALTVSAISLLDEILSKNNISYDLYLTDSGFRDDATHSISIGCKIVEYKCIDKAFFRKGFKSFALKIIQNKLYIRSRSFFKKVDFLFDIGQGDSFADIYGINRFNLINSSYEIAKSYKIPTCILPQTIGPFESEVIRKRALKSILQSKMVLTRDKQSFDYVKEMTSSQTVSEIIDVAFFMPYQKKTFSPDKIHVGLNISALLWNGGYTGDNQFGLLCNYQELIRSIITHFLSIENVVLHLVSHVVGGERNVENDYAVSYDLYEEYNHKNLILAPLFLDPIIAKSYIAGMDYFMGARMHSTIAAFSTNVPVYPMAYSRKFNGLFVDTLQYEYMGDMKVQDNNALLTNIKKTFEKRSDLKTIIKERMDNVVMGRHKLLMDNLAKFLGL